MKQRLAQMSAGYSRPAILIHLALYTFNLWIPRMFSAAIWKLPHGPSPVKWACRFGRKGSPGAYVRGCDRRGHWMERRTAGDDWPSIRNALAWLDVLLFASHHPCLLWARSIYFFLDFMVQWVGHSWVSLEQGRECVWLEYLPGAGLVLGFPHGSS